MVSFRTIILKTIPHVLHNNHRCLICVVLRVGGRLHTQNFVKLEIFTVFMKATWDLSKNEQKNVAVPDCGL